jgi:HD-GYP domain-containing protein (c-di-GMP phosphodiesterase class II)
VDGDGRLDGLASISRSWRVLSVVDAFSAATTTRTYRKVLSVEEYSRGRPMQHRAS